MFFIYFLFFNIYIYIYISSQVKTEEISLQVSLENFKGLSIPDGGGKFIPPARNGE